MGFHFTGVHSLGIRVGFCALVGLALSGISLAGPREQATRLFDRLASAPLSLKDTRRAQMETLLSQGKILEAAQIATADDGFYNLTLKTWATPMSNRPEDAQVAQRSNELHYLTDFAAMVIGSTRDGMNAQELLNGDFTYYVTEAITGVTAYQPVNGDSNNHYETLERAAVNLRQKLVRVIPQRANNPDAAGLITSQAWGHAHFRDGTNRRVIHYALREFLCTDIDGLRDSAYPTTRIRRDVDRAPGGDATVFTNTCRSCHGGMDGLAGAFAHFDYGFRNFTDGNNVAIVYPAGYFPGSQLIRFPNAVETGTNIVRKYNQNTGVFPAGYITVDDSWVNYFAASQTAANKAIGWPAGMTSGSGAKSLGTMLANTRGFPVCMAKRVFKKVCARAAGAADTATIGTLADQFIAGGYKLKSLFENAAILPGCLGQ